MRRIWWEATHMIICPTIYTYLVLQHLAGAVPGAFKTTVDLQRGVRTARSLVKQQQKKNISIGQHQIIGAEIQH